MLLWRLFIGPGYRADGMDGSLPAFMRTTTFRFTALAAGAFALSSALVLVFLYASLRTTLAGRVDGEIAEEVSALNEAYRKGGLNALNRAVARRSLDDEDFLYILTYASGRRLSGSLDGIPSRAAQTGGSVWFDYVPQRGGDGGRRRARGYVSQFPGGFVLFVGRDFANEARFLARAAQTGWAATLIVVVLAFGSGVFVSRRFARRLDLLNVVVRDVGAGDMRKRAGRTHTNDELDALAGNLNAMLDRIEHLMAGLRHAGDSIAHDLRSPLTRLRARLEAARPKSYSSERYASESDPAGGDQPAPHGEHHDDAVPDPIDKAIDDVDALLATFDAVMRIARLEAGEKRASLEALDLGALTADLGELYEPACEDKLLEMSTQAVPGVMVMADRALVSQAIANLLDNAIKYTPHGGAVTLRTRLRRDGRAEVSVTDTGPGIPEDARERVRQRFVRLDESRTLPGTGLGLSLVEAVAKIHNGAFLLDDGPGMVAGNARDGDVPSFDGPGGDGPGGDMPSGDMPGGDARGPGLRAALVLPVRPG